MTTTYKIRFQHGVGGTLEKHEPIYSYIVISGDEYIKLKEAMEYQRFLVKLERAYEHIIDNYHDFEKNIFSIILVNELYTEGSQSQFNKEYSSFIKHLLNILTATYLYTSVLKIKQKDKKEVQKKPNDSFENSSDLQEIYDLKLLFKDTTNNFHKARYQYTFMSALRNKLNHGGTLPEGYTIGGYWSLYRDKEKTRETGIVINDTDQRFSKLDYKISREVAKQIIIGDKKKNKQAHFDAIKNDMPNEFYLRQAIRIYIDLISHAHAHVRSNTDEAIKKTTECIKDYFSKAVDKFSLAVIIIESHEKFIEEALFLSEDVIEEMKKENKAPLSIERYAGMPGEHRNLPVLDEPIHKRRK